MAMVVMLDSSPPKKVSRSDFSNDFIFGVSSSSYQYEGAAAKGGRGPSIWDVFTQETPYKIKDYGNGHLANDSYYRYKEDVQIVKKMGLDAYRFSISWPRVLPGGKLCKGVNMEGIKYYNDLIDELLANGIEPYVTLFHWDLPNALEEEYKGFLSSQIVSEFCEFVELCFWEFGDRVKNWITFNEPFAFCCGGYVTGSLAPGRGPLSSKQIEVTSLPRKCHTWEIHDCTNGNPGTEPYIVAHNQLLAHAAAVELYMEKFQACQQGKIGITLVSQWCEPLDPNSMDDLHASKRALDFMFGWFMEPLTTGDYPETMRKNVGPRLPHFSKEQSKKVKGSYDFLGLNYYTGTYVTTNPKPTIGKQSYDEDSQVTYLNERDGKPIGPQSSSGQYIYPKGFHKLLVYIKEAYNNPLIYITENGVGQLNESNKTLSEVRVDQIRIDFYHDHLLALETAIADRVRVKGYFAWTLMDDFEYNEGYNLCMGLIHVDRKCGLLRYPKCSAIWFKDFLAKGKPKYLGKRRITENGEVESVKKMK